MSWVEVRGYIWELVNSAPGITVIAGMFVYALNKLFTKKPKWKEYYIRYEGALISAVKQAEKYAEDSGKTKLEKALELVVATLEKSAGKITDTQKEELKIAISKTHDDLEAKGTLHASSNTGE